MANAVNQSENFDAFTFPQEEQPEQESVETRLAKRILLHQLEDKYSKLVQGIERLPEGISLDYGQDLQGTSPDQLVGKWVTRIAPVVRQLHHINRDGLMMMTLFPVPHPDRSYMGRAVKILSVDSHQKNIKILKKRDELLKETDRLFLGKEPVETEEDTLSKDYWDNNWMEVGENYSNDNLATADYHRWKARGY